ncbi:IclR family transcriptional regulator [Roseomonas chloroacetimidivorans]|uniref:IclR family transcriptional regulator n=1 Tax=Roseomonas chloroacetimidivorans TaxID=1766656 RepID=UPI003C7388FE
MGSKRPAAAGGGRRNGVQSIEVGAQLLEALARSAVPQHLRDLAAGAGMPPSKARRYLVSLLRCGLVEQNPTTSRYELGPMALRVGLSALNSRHVVRLATEAVIQLNQEIDRTILLSIWTERGPVIIGWYDSSEMLICNLNVGSVLPLLHSVSGRLFLAYLPRASTQRLLEREINSALSHEGAFPVRTEMDVRSLIAGVRKNRFAMTQELLLPGLSAFGAPVFDHEGRMAAAVAMIGPPGTIEAITPDSPATLLRRRAEELSLRLGFHSREPGGSLAEWLELGTAEQGSTPPPALSIPVAKPQKAPKARQARTAS